MNDREKAREAAIVQILNEYERSNDDGAFDKCVNACFDAGLAHAEGQLAEVTAERDRYKAALAHYADYSNWALSDAQVGDLDLYRPNEDTDVMITHGYEIAKAALKQKP